MHAYFVPFRPISDYAKGIVTYLNLHAAMDTYVSKFITDVVETTVRDKGSIDEMEDDHVIGYFKESGNIVLTQHAASIILDSARSFMDGYTENHLKHLPSVADVHRMYFKRNGPNIIIEVIPKEPRGLVKRDILPHDLAKSIKDEFIALHSRAASPRQRRCLKALAVEGQKLREELDYLTSLSHSEENKDEISERTTYLADAWTQAKTVWRI